jgi:DNA-binding GntR family transcriptional regulator
MVRRREQLAMNNADTTMADGRTAGPSPADANVTNMAYDAIRKELLACRLAPASRVSVLGLSKQLSVNQSAIREALSRLTAEGLVGIEPNRGFVVTPITVGRFASLSKARTSIDALCLREAIAVADIEFEVELVAASHRVLRRLEGVEGNESEVAHYVDAHARFHETLVSRCGNPWLLWMRSLLFAQSVRYRHFCLPFAREKSDFYSADGPFLQAVFRKDADKAERLLVSQYERVCALICDRLKELLPG